MQLHESKVLKQKTSIAGEGGNAVGWSDSGGDPGAGGS